MKKTIYIGHSNKLDYVNELYKPIRNSKLSDEYEIILPYEKVDKPVNSKEIIEKCDLFIAEVSLPSTGLGIEIGWASMLEVRIICIYKKGVHVSRSLRVVTKNLVEYLDCDDMVEKLDVEIKRILK